MEDKIYLVTGATGFVGSHMARLLLRSGLKVRVFVRNREKAVGIVNKWLIETEADPSLLEIAEGSLEDHESIKRAVIGVSGIYHIGAAYREAKHSEEYFFKVNAEGTRLVFEEGIKAGVKRIIHCSTTGVLGDVKNPPADDTTPYAPLDEYQRSKTEAEKIALEFYNSNKVGGVVIRPAMIYGPEDTRFLKMFRMISRGTFFYVGDGSQLCHYVNVEDLVLAFKLAMEKEDINGKIYTIAGDKIISLKVMVDLIAKYLGVKEPWIHLPIKPMQMAGIICENLCKPFGIEPPLYKRRVDFFTKNRSFNISKAKLDLGYAPKMSFEEELRYVTKWYQDNNML